MQRRRLTVPVALAAIPWLLARQASAAPAISPASPPAAPTSAPPLVAPPSAAPAASPPVAPTPAPYPYAPAPYVAPTYPEPPGFHQHDGFFLRMALGPAFISDSGKATYSDNRTPAKYTVKGAGPGLEIAIGGALSPNVILAGTLDVASANSATYRSEGFPDTELALSVSWVGVLADVYPVASSGFHLGGALGFGDIKLDNGANQTNDNTRGGFSLAAILGYEWWIGADWGIGVMGRVAFVRGSRSVPTNGSVASITETDTDSAVAPALLFTATYN